MSITIQKATINDLETFLALEKSVADSKFYSAIVDEEEAREEFTKSEVYLIKKDDEVVGSIYYEIKTPDHVYLSGLVVKPGFQKQGIARAALEQLLEKFKNIKRINLVAHPENPARRLYESLGFKAEKQIENYFGDGEPRLLLSKQG